MPDREDTRAQLRFERFLADVAVSFLRTPPDAIDAAVERAVAGLTRVLDVDRCGLALFSPGLRELNLEHSFAEPGVPALLHGDVATLLPWYTQQVRQGRRVLLASPEQDLPLDALADRRHIASLGLRSHVGVPLLASDGPLGVLGVSSFSTERQWSEPFLTRLELLAAAFASVVDRRRAEGRLRAAQSLNRSVLRSLASELLTLDGDGVVSLVNDTTLRAARRRGFSTREGADYLALLARQAESGFPDAPRLAEGIRSVLSGAAERFETGYTFPVSEEPDHHYLLRVTTLEGQPGAIVLHTDVSALEHAAVQYQRATAGVERASARLKGASVALRRGLQQAERAREHLKAAQALQSEATRVLGFDGIVGRSASLLRMLDEIQQVAPTDAPVLLLGETGTGKELVAHAVHERSRRGERPFVIVNCAALPPDLIESELFGHERGAFTGASHRSAGRFEVADGGTLFLDEIGELSPGLQAKLLRVLQSGEFERLGSPRTIRTDVRLVAATNRDLSAAMREGRFRDDLYYRLGVFPVVLPPLRERREDIPVLVWHFVAQKQDRLGKAVERIPEPLMQAFTAHPWPGNVRELENTIERALILTDGPILAAAPEFLRHVQA